MHKALRSIAALACAATIAFGTSASAQPERHPWTQPGHLRIGSTEEPDGINPLLSHNAASEQIETLLFAYMFRYDAQGNLMPELATAVPTYENGGVSRDGKTITLHMRPGLTWADGAPLDARDMAFTYRAVMNPANNTKLRTGWDDIASFTTPNRLTVVVRLNHVNSGIIPALFGCGGSGYPPLPEHILGKLPDINHADFNNMPLASGPFALKAWNRGASLEFVPNPHYWRGAPKLRELSYMIVPNPDVLFNELRTHEIDLVDNITEADQARLATIPGITIKRRITANWRHLEINTSRPLLRDVRVRRAIAEAIDWDRIDATIYHHLNMRATSDILPNSWAAPKIPLFPYDPAHAKALLEAAGWHMGPKSIRMKNGVPLEIAISSTPIPSNEQGELQMQQDLAAVGILLDIKNYAASLLFAEDGPLYKGTFDLSWSIDTNLSDPDNTGLWDSHYMPPHGGNTAFLSDPIVDKTGEAALLTFDHAKRKALYQREEMRLHELVPAVIFYWEVSTVAYNSDLIGYVPAALDVAAMWNAYAWEI